MPEKFDLVLNPNESQKPSESVSVYERFADRFYRYYQPYTYGLNSMERVGTGFISKPSQR